MTVDEIRMVRELYGEPAPDLELAARLRAQLTDGPSRRRRFGTRATFGLGGLVAAAAAAAVAVASLGTGSPAPAAKPPTTKLSAKAVLLAAAEKVERQPTGNYWYKDVVDGQAYVIRAKTGTYAITGATGESFSWHGKKSGMGETYYLRDLPAHPHTKRDEELWRKAGSPSSFRVWSSDKWLTFPTKGTNWRSSGPEAGANPEGGGDFLGESAEELQGLPTDPAQLAEMFLSEKEIERMSLGGRRSPGQNEVLAGTLKIRRVAGLLMNSPIPPKVRAGLMRALANEPGVEAVGKVTDPLGRQGVALVSADRPTTDNGEYGGPKADQGTYRWRTAIVFDERTGALLSIHTELTKPGGKYAEMKPGFIIDYQAVRSSGWTDTKPTPPAELPF